MTIQKQEKFMENGYKILWTDHALKELEQSIEYLENNFTEKEIKKLAKEIEKIICLIENNPKIFPESESINIRRVIILKFNTLYYRIVDNNIEILSFFSNRQNPTKSKLFK